MEGLRVWPGDEWRVGGAKLVCGAEVAGVAVEGDGVSGMVASVGDSGAVLLLLVAVLLNLEEEAGEEVVVVVVVAAVEMEAWKVFSSVKCGLWKRK